jgi:hypothetical protein
MYKIAGSILIGLSNGINRFLLKNSVRALALSNHDELRILQTHFKDHDGTELPVEYLQSGKSFVFLDKNNDVTAGFALIENRSLRSIEQIPIAPSEELLGCISELTAVFSTVGSGVYRFRFWSFVIGTALASKSRYIVYAVDASKPTLRKNVFNYIRESILYEGPVKMLSGMSQQTIEAVEVASKSSLSKGFALLAVMEVLKFRG